ncbi:MAG: hypothetical protein LBC87_03250 [Fibromonadaceae bacterium]|jgi:hypothetical protein|nr:hypothetical protein [Fibromonadaceae bacterium]
MPKFLLPLAFLALCACKEKNNVSNYDALALVYAELRLATQEYGETENGRAIRFQILEKHGFSADSFEIKTEELKEKPEKWLIFQKTVIDILDSIAKPDSVAKPDTIVKKDTIAK